MSSRNRRESIQKEIKTEKSIYVIFIDKLMPTIIFYVTYRQYIGMLMYLLSLLFFLSFFILEISVFYRKMIN